MTYSERELTDHDLIELGRGLAALLEPRVLAVVVPLAKQQMGLAARLDTLAARLTALEKDRHDAL